MSIILIADDDHDICMLLSRFLTKNGYEAVTVSSGGKALEQIRTNKVDLLLCDFRLGDMEGTEVLATVKTMQPTLPVIIITGYSDIKVAVNLIKAGAYDYVTKPIIPDEILLTIKKALSSKEKETVDAKGEGQSKPVIKAKPSDFINGESSEAQELKKQIDLVAPTNYSVIIYGESGAGKEVAARMIHNNSTRSNKPFVAMDCGAISKELAGSELFGHEKGSFTGALTTKIGHFELANGGTLFLDEVANLSYEVQTSLLRVVQERKVKRIGGTKEIPFDVRIVVASNENLSESCRKGKFREDLFYRFNEFNLSVPALRQRQQDIMVFANHYLSMANKELGKQISGFNEEVVDCFMHYSWPGNVRELKNVVKRATLLANDSSITLRELPAEITNYKNAAVNQGNKLQEESSSPDLKQTAHEAEYHIILDVLKKVNYNKTKAAKLLNIDRKTLYNKMKAFDL